LLPIQKSGGASLAQIGGIDAKIGGGDGDRRQGRGQEAGTGTGTGGRGRDRDRDRDGDRRLPIFGGPGVEDTINVVSASHCLWWTVSRAANCTFSS